MTGQEPARGCLVALLVPHPLRTAVLVADNATSPVIASSRSGPRLPTLHLSSAEPLLSEVLAAINLVDTATTPVLRQVVISTSDAHGEQDQARDVQLLVEFDSTTAQAPPGWSWHDLDADALARVQPVSFREALASWAGERAHGWAELRPPWSRPGWLAEARTWVVEQMQVDGRPALGSPRQHHLWGMSVVLRASSADGDVFFKASPPLFRREAVLTQALAQRMPGLVPEVIAVDGVRGWLLMRDLDAPELGDQDEELWHEGLVAHADIQRSWLGRADELADLGVPARSLLDLATQVEDMAHDRALVQQMSAELRAEWLAAAPELIESCRRLDQIGPGPTLVHGDLHPWNLVRGSEGVRVFDWTDAAVSHPFVDLATYVFKTADISRRRRLLDAYLDAWSADLSAELLHEAATLGLVVGTLYQVQTYRTLLPTVTRQGADDDLAGADFDWIRRTLSRLQMGLESPR